MLWPGQGEAWGERASELGFATAVLPAEGVEGCSQQEVKETAMVRLLLRSDVPAREGFSFLFFFFPFFFFFQRGKKYSSIPN